jgi:transposase-like protein
MRGRQPPGPEFVERLRGSPSSKERATVILQTLSGQLRVQEAAALLGITPQRFHVLRQEAVQGLVDQLEPRPLGRPHKPPSTVSELETELARLERERRLGCARRLPWCCRRGRRGPSQKKTRIANLTGPLGFPTPADR